MIEKRIAGCPFPHWHRWLTVAAVATLSTIGAMAGRTPPAQAQHSPGFAPVQLIKAYNFAPLYRRGIKGAGQTIAFMEVDGVDGQDIAHFDRAFGLSAARLDVFYPSDATQALAPGPETTMDVEWAHALAPDARLQVYEVIHVGDFSHYPKYLATAISAAISRGATVISISLRGTGNILCSTFWSALSLHGTLQSAASKGVTIFASSGDYGDHPCQSSHSVGTVYPASDPNITSVGGTSLTLAADGGYGSETAWSGSGGGYSADFSRPSWQHGPGSFNPHYRSVPDVAFVANPQTGVLVYLQGQWLASGGTSLGAPCWAALWALASQYHHMHTHHALAVANPLLYALGASAQRGRAFHDVTSGGNGHYHAGPGYDEVTGLGSPNADGLVRALTP